MKDGLTKEEFMKKANKVNEKFPTFDPSTAWDDYSKKQREKIVSAGGSGVMSRDEFLKSVESISRSDRMFEPHRAYDDYLKENLPYGEENKKESPAVSPVPEIYQTCSNCYTSIPKDTLKIVNTDRHGQVPVCHKCFLKFCINHDIEKEYSQKEYFNLYGTMYTK